MNETTNVNPEAQKNQANRVLFEREWERLSMPGHPERTTLDDTANCGRFVTVRDYENPPVEYELEVAVRVLSDFHDAEGRNLWGEKKVRAALERAGAVNDGRGS